jgi:predicted phosphodiesterase
VKARSKVRVVIPDSHGNHIDMAARNACLADVKRLTPDEIVMLGDHVDAGGTFNTHQRTYTNEMTESYEDDCAAASEFLNLIQKAAPKARVYYLEGNHEQHVERWASRSFASHKDAERLLERYAPAAILELRRRGISYHKRSEHYMGISIPGTIRLGKCFFVHGISHSKHAAAVHRERFGGSVVFGHVHRSQADIGRTVMTQGIGAWCPGTLAKLQPLYRHTEPTAWSHGYGVQFVAPSGLFLHVNVTIHAGESLLNDLAARVA